MIRTSAMNPVAFGAAQVEVNRDKLRQISENGMGPRPYLRMKTLFRKTDEFLAQPKVVGRLEAMSETTSIQIAGYTRYDYLDCRPYMQAGVKVRDVETNHVLQSSFLQSPGESVAHFLRRVLRRAARWDKQLNGSTPKPLKPEDNQGGSYKFR